MADFFTSLAAQAVGVAPRIVPVVLSLGGVPSSGFGDVHEVRETASEADGAARLGVEGYVSHASRPPSGVLNGMDDEGGRSRGATGSGSGLRVSALAERSAEVPMHGAQDGLELPSDQRGPQEGDQQRGPQDGGQQRGRARPPGSLEPAGAAGPAARSVPAAVPTGSSPPAKPDASVPYSAEAPAGDAHPEPQSGVHVSVSIGRVEIRVPTAPPAPTSVRERAPAPAPRLTLDKYLGRNRSR
jgi:hypothetical protein